MTTTHLEAHLVFPTSGICQGLCRLHSGHDRPFMLCGMLCGVFYDNLCDTTHLEAHFILSASSTGQRLCRLHGGHDWPTQPLSGMAAGAHHVAAAAAAKGLAQVSAQQANDNSRISGTPRSCSRQADRIKFCFQHGGGSSGIHRCTITWTCLRIPCSMHSCCCSFACCCLTH